MTIAASPLPDHRSSRTILAVEDEVMLLEILAEELEDRGYRVLRAMTGDAAVSMLREKSEDIDLLITDIRLPGSVDGWGIAEEARRLRPDLPVIYVTGYFANASREVTGSVIITKPYRPSAIINAARQFGVG